VGVVGIILIGSGIPSLREQGQALDGRTGTGSGLRNCVRKVAIPITES